MLNKKSIRIISIVMLAIVLLMVMGNTVLAAVSIPSPTNPEVSNINNLVGKILGIIRWGGLILAVIIAMFVGIKFITASPEGKAEVKKTIMYYVAGIVILLAASSIVTVIGNSVGGSGTVTDSGAKTSSIVTSINA